MKIESGRLNLNAYSVEDAGLMSIARRGVRVQHFDGIVLPEHYQQVQDEIFWAGQLAAVNQFELKQLNLLEPDKTQLEFNVSEAVALAAFLTDGLRYPEGATRKIYQLSLLSNRQRPRQVNRLNDFELQDAALTEEVLPMIREFATKRNRVN